MLLPRKIISIILPNHPRFPPRRITWFGAAVVPALCALAVTPYIVYKLAPPEIKDTPEAPGAARERLKQLGPLTRDEKLMVCALSALHSCPAPALVLLLR